MGSLFMLHLRVNMDFNIKLGLIISYKSVKTSLRRKKMSLNYNSLSDVIAPRNPIIMFIFNEVLISFTNVDQML